MWDPQNGTTNFGKLPFNEIMNNGEAKIGNYMETALIRPLVYTTF